MCRCIANDVTSLCVVSQNVSLAVVGMGEKLLIIDDDKVQPYVSSTLLLTMRACCEVMLDTVVV